VTIVKEASTTAEQQGCKTNHWKVRGLRNKATSRDPKRRRQNPERLSGDQRG